MIVKLERIQFDDGRFRKGRYGVKVVDGKYESFPSMIKKVRKEVIEKVRMDHEMILKIGHENLVRIFDIKLEGDHYYIAVDSYTCSLKYFFDVCESTEYDPQNMMRDLATGLEYLHSKELYHGRLNPETIFICQSTKVAKISDFMILAGSEFSEKDVSKIVTLYLK